MTGKRIFHSLLFFAMCASSLHATPPTSLVPHTPVTLISNGSITMPPVVAATNAGFMTTAVSNLYLQPNFSDNNGYSWITRPAILENSYRPMWVAGNTQGFMAVWLGDDIGPSTGTPFFSFSSDNGVTWTTGAPISNTNAIGSPVVVTATAAGFLATWKNRNTNEAYASFTSNNGATWSTPATLSNTENVSSPVIAAGNASGFMATWIQDNTMVMGAFSADGITWNSPITLVFVLGGPTTFANSWVAANSTGFMIAWAEANNGTARAMFTSNNGDSWSNETDITSNMLYNPNATHISVTGSSAGFIATWIGSDSHAYASYNSTGITTWSSAAQITTSANVSHSSSSGLAFISASSIEDRCMFTWLGTNGNTYASFSTIGPVRTPSSFTGTQKKNNFGLMYELYNKLEWSFSSSSDISNYRIYKNDVLIATVSPQTNSYENHNQEPNITTNYSIQAVNGAGSTSSLSLLQFVNGTAHTVALG